MKYNVYLRRVDEILNDSQPGQSKNFLQKEMGRIFTF